MCVLYIGYEAESECPEETIAISSNLSISIDIFVHFFVQILSDGGAKLVDFLPDKHGDGDGVDWILDCLEFFVGLVDFLG